MERIKHKTRLPTANVNKSLPETPQPPSKPAPPNGMPRSQPQVFTTSTVGSSTVRHQFPKTNTPPTAVMQPLITEDDMQAYYSRLINYEFRNLQLDSEVKSKSLFDLIDYCELQYETANVQLQTGATDPNATLKGIKTYIKGYLVFNYFINSFIMVHFKGFDTFIESNEQDFIIYLNIFAFYNSNEYFQNGNYSIQSEDLREYVKKYLVDKNLLSFNIEELYSWLNEYITYLKEKDKSTEEQASVSSSSSSFSFVEEVYATPDLRQSTHSRNSSITSENEFKQKYPSIKRVDSPPSEFISKQIPPPIPTQLPPSLLESITDLKSVSPNASPPSPTPTPPSPPPHRVSTSEYPISSDTFLTKERNRTSYPVQDNILGAAVPSEEQAYFQPKSYSRPKNEVPDGYLRPTDYTKTRMYHKSNNLVSSNGNMNGYDLRLAQGHQIDSPIVQGSNVHFPPPPPQQQPIYHQPVQPIPYQPNMQLAQPIHQSYSYYQQPNQPIYHARNTQPQMYQPPAHYNNTHSHVPAHVVQQQEQIKHQKNSILKEYSICGLRNFGSSCYINSTIQLLFGVYPFKSIFNHGYQKYVKDPKYLRILAKPNSHTKESVLLSEAISGLLRTFQQNGGVSVSPTKFIRVTSLLKPDFNIPHEQQDAQEFLLFVLDRLHEELADKRQDNYDPELSVQKWRININMENKDKYMEWCKSLHEHEGSSPIMDLFQGHLQNKLKCNKCGYESVSYSPFSILSLPIPNNYKNEVNLSDCLRYYIQDEVLSGENAWHCPKCNGEVQTLENHPVFENKRSGIFRLGGKKKHTKSQQTQNNSTNTISTKSINFVKLPTILFIHLSRFSMYNLTDKLDTMIKYPLLLKFNNQGHEIVYKLTGMINHFGNLKSGHYTSLVNKSTVHEKLQNSDNLKRPCWCLFDDEHVRSNLAHGALNPPHDELVSRDVYVLCYERIDV